MPFYRTTLYRARYRYYAVTVLSIHLIRPLRPEASIPGGTEEWSPKMWSWGDINMDVLQSFCVMCICAYGIVVQCYNCVFIHLSDSPGIMKWGLCYQTRLESDPVYSSALELGPPLLTSSKLLLQLRLPTFKHSWVNVRTLDTFSSIKTFEK